MEPADGSYTSPSALPDGQLLVSYGAGDPATFGGDYDIYVVDPATGIKTKVAGAAGTAETEAVAIYPRASAGVFRLHLRRAQRAYVRQPSGDRRGRHGARYESSRVSALSKHAHWARHRERFEKLRHLRRVAPRRRHRAVSDGECCHG